MKRILKFLIFLLIGVLLITGGIRLIKKRKSELSNLPAPQEPVYVVKGTFVKQGVVEETVSYLGKVVPENEIYISTKFSGRVKKILVSEGDRVKKGQLIAQIDGIPVKTAVENLKAEEKILKSQLRSLEAQLEAAQSDYQFAKTNFERDRRLFKGKAISEIQFLKSKTLLDSAKAKVEALKSNIFSTKDRISSLQRQIEEKENDLTYLEIHSCCDGIVDRVFVKEGNLAIPGKPLLKIQSLDKKVLLSFPIKYSGTIKRPAVAYIKINGKTEKFHISKIYPSADNNSLAVAEIKLKRADLITNSFVNVKLITKVVKGLVVPKLSVLHLSNGTFILTNKEGRFIKIPVKVIAEDEKNAVVKGNIKEGTPVAVAMENKLRLLASGKKGKILLEGKNR